MKILDIFTIILAVVDILVRVVMAVVNVIVIVTLVPLEECEVKVVSAFVLVGYDVVDKVGKDVLDTIVVLVVCTGLLITVPEFGVEDRVGKGGDDKVVKSVFVNTMLLVIESEDVYRVGVLAELFT